MKRGDIYWADLSPRSGSEQQGRRPVLVISEDALNAMPSWKSVIVIPISTSEAQAARGLSSVALLVGDGGLTANSTALCHQITTLDKSKLEKRLGTLSEAVLNRVVVGVGRAVGIELEFEEVP